MTTDRQLRNTFSCCGVGLFLVCFLLLACAADTGFDGDFSPEAPLMLIGPVPFRIGHPSFVLSSDGETMVYVGGDERESRLYRRALASSDASPIPGTEGAYGPFFSPDGRRIGFFAEDRLKHVSLAGGDVVTLATVHHTRGGAWLGDDTILYADHECARLYAIPAAGGAPYEAVAGGGCWPYVLPGGRRLLLASWNLLVAVDLDTSRRTVLFEDEMVGFGVPKYAPSGHLLFVNRGRLLAVPFDATALEATGEPFVVVSTIRTEMLTNAAHYAVTPGGGLIYVSGGQAGHGQLVWVSESGTETPLAIPPGLFGEYRLDLPASRLAFSLREERWGLFVHDLQAGTTTALSTEGDNYSPAWTPDGRSVIFRSKRGATWDIFRAAGDGSAPAEMMLAGGEFTVTQFVAADGLTLITSEAGESGLGDVVSLPLDGKRPTVRLVEGAPSEWDGVPSPDEELLAYMTDEFGSYEVMVKPMGGGTPVRVSQGGGMDPVWSIDGRTLYFHDVRRVMSADIETEPSLRAGPTTVLFEGRFVDIGGYGWDRVADGRFLLVRETEDSSRPVTLRLIENWTRGGGR